MFARSFHGRRSSVSQGLPVLIVENRSNACRIRSHAERLRILHLRWQRKISDSARDGPRISGGRRVRYPPGIGIRGDHEQMHPAGGIALGRRCPGGSHSLASGHIEFIRDRAHYPGSLISADAAIGDRDAENLLRHASDDCVSALQAPPDQLQIAQASLVELPPEQAVVRSSRGQFQQLTCIGRQARMLGRSAKFLEVGLRDSQQGPTERNDDSRVRDARRQGAFIGDMDD